MNKKVFQVIGLQRSGNHAFIQWILDHENGRKCFLNNISPIGNPFLTAKNNLLQEYNTKINFELEAKIPTDKDVLVMSMEDQYPEHFLNSDWEKARIESVGGAEEKVDIIIIREPYNFFASRIKFEEGCELGIVFKSTLRKFFMTSLKIVGKLDDLYKLDYEGKSIFKKCVINFRDLLNGHHRARIPIKNKLDLEIVTRIYLSYVHLFRTNKKIYFVLFDNWLLDSNYRSSLSKIFKLSGRGIEIPKKQSSMSSFNKYSLKKIKNRWQEMENNSLMKEIINDSKLEGIRNSIF